MFDLAKIFTPDTIIFVVIVSVVLTGITLLLLRFDTKKYKVFRETISKGTEVCASTSQGSYNGIVTDIDEEFVTIESKVRRHRIYPKTKTK